MDIYSDAYNPTATTIYFVSCVLVCSFFILNLTVAVMFDEYAKNEAEN